jgi:hypothetical protein
MVDIALLHAVNAKQHITTTDGKRIEANIGYLSTIEN